MIDGLTSRHPGYMVSQQKWVEGVFGWLKTVGLLRKVKLCGAWRIDWFFSVAATVYNLVYIRNLAGGVAVCRNLAC